MQLHRVLSVIISDLQFTTSKKAMSIRYKLILNIISMKYFYGYYLAICMGRANVNYSKYSNFECCHSLG